MRLFPPSHSTPPEQSNETQQEKIQTTLPLYGQYANIVQVLHRGDKLLVTEQKNSALEEITQSSLLSGNNLDFGNLINPDYSGLEEKNFTSFFDTSLQSGAKHLDAYIDELGFAYVLSGSTLYYWFQSSNLATTTEDSSYYAPKSKFSEYRKVRGKLSISTNSSNISHFVSFVVQKHLQRNIQDSNIMEDEESEDVHATIASVGIFIVDAHGNYKYIVDLLAKEQRIIEGSFDKKYNFCLISRKSVNYNGAVYLATTSNELFSITFSQNQCFLQQLTKQHSNPLAYVASWFFKNGTSSNTNNRTTIRKISEFGNQLFVLTDSGVEIWKKDNATAHWYFKDAWEFTGILARKIQQASEGTDPFETRNLAFDIVSEQRIYILTASIPKLPKESVMEPLLSFHIVQIDLLNKSVTSMILFTETEVDPFLYQKGIDHSKWIGKTELYLNQLTHDSYAFYCIVFDKVYFTLEKEVNTESVELKQIIGYGMIGSELCLLSLKHGTVFVSSNLEEDVKEPIAIELPFGKSIDPSDIQKDYILSLFQLYKQDKVRITKPIKDYEALVRASKEIVDTKFVYTKSHQNEQRNLLLLSHLEARLENHDLFLQFVLYYFKDKLDDQQHLIPILTHGQQIHICYQLRSYHSTVQWKKLFLQMGVTTDLSKLYLIFTKIMGECVEKDNSNIQEQFFNQVTQVELFFNKAIGIAQETEVTDQRMYSMLLVVLLSAFCSMIDGIEVHQRKFQSAYEHVPISTFQTAITEYCIQLLEKLMNWNESQLIINKEYYLILIFQLGQFAVQNMRLECNQFDTSKLDQKIVYNRKLEKYNIVTLSFIDYLVTHLEWTNAKQIAMEHELYFPFIEITFKEFCTKYSSTTISIPYFVKEMKETVNIYGDLFLKNLIEFYLKKQWYEECINLYECNETLLVNQLVGLQRHDLLWTLFVKLKAFSQAFDSLHFLILNSDNHSKYLSIIKILVKCDPSLQSKVLQLETLLYLSQEQGLAMSHLESFTEEQLIATLIAIPVNSTIDSVKERIQKALQLYELLLLDKEHRLYALLWQQIWRTCYELELKNSVAENANEETIHNLEPITKQKLKNCFFVQFIMQEREHVSLNQVKSFVEAKKDEMDDKEKNIFYNIIHLIPLLAK